MMKHAGSVTFTDGDSGDEAFVSVRCDEGMVALVVSEKKLATWKFKLGCHPGESRGP